MPSLEVPCGSQYRGTFHALRRHDVLEDGRLFQKYRAGMVLGSGESSVNQGSGS